MFSKRRRTPPPPDVSFLDFGGGRSSSLFQTSSLGSPGAVSPRDIPNPSDYGRLRSPSIYDPLGPNSIPNRQPPTLPSLSQAIDGYGMRPPSPTSSMRSYSSASFSASPSSYYGYGPSPSFPQTPATPYSASQYPSSTSVSAYV